MLEESFLIEKSQQTSSQNISASANCTELRIPLLLQCIYENPIAINYVARYLLFIIKAEEQKYINNKVETIIILDDTNQWYTENEQNGKFLRKKIAEQLLLLLYMHVPRIIHHISGSDRDKIFKKIYLTGIYYKIYHFRIIEYKFLLPIYIIQKRFSLYAKYLCQQIFQFLKQI